MVSGQCGYRGFHLFICVNICFLFLHSVLQQAGRNPSSATLNKYWTATTSKLNFDDFCEILKHEEKTEESELMRVFKKMDVNGDGYITHSELEKALITVSSLTLWIRFSSSGYTLVIK